MRELCKFFRQSEGANIGIGIASYRIQERDRLSSSKNVDISHRALTADWIIMGFPNRRHWVGDPHHPVDASRSHYAPGRRGYWDPVRSISENPRSTDDWPNLGALEGSEYSGLYARHLVTIADTIEW